MMGSVLASPQVKGQTAKAKEAFNKALELGRERNAVAMPEPQHVLPLVDLCLSEGAEKSVSGGSNLSGVEEALQVLAKHEHPESLELNLKLGLVLCQTSNAAHHHRAIEVNLFVAEFKLQRSIGFH